jgi:hypothetical protein
VGRNPPQNLQFEEDWEAISSQGSPSSYYGEEEEQPYLEYGNPIEYDIPFTGEYEGDPEFKHPSTAGRGLKKMTKNNKGGKLSVSNLSKFFKSSYAIANKKEPPKKIDTYNLDSDLTNKYGSVYYDQDKNHAVLTHTGTYSGADWFNNGMYALGLYKYTDRYKQGKKLQDATHNKYGAENVSTLAHSQGSVNARAHGQNSKEIINLNPAYKGERPLKNEYNIRSSGDIVSIALHPTNRSHDTVIPATTNNPLTEHNIDILDRLDQEQMIGGKLRKKNKNTMSKILMKRLNK